MNSLKKILSHEYLWLSILIIIYFIIQKSNSTRFFYVIIAVALSLYFFPVRVIIDFFKQKKILLMELLSNFFVGTTIAFSIPVLYLLPNETSNFKILIACFGLINLLLLIHFYMKNKKQYKNTHLVLIFLIAVLFSGV